MNVILMSVTLIRVVGVVGILYAFVVIFAGITMLKDKKSKFKSGLEKSLDDKVSILFAYTQFVAGGIGTVLSVMSIADYRHYLIYLSIYAAIIFISWIVLVVGAKKFEVKKA